LGLLIGDGCRTLAVWASAAGCMRNYLILRAMVRALRDDPDAAATRGWPSNTSTSSPLATSDRPAVQRPRTAGSRMGGRVTDSSAVGLPRSD
jgi:hypothetical protein